jgi:hypothetical protein
MTKLSAIQTALLKRTAEPEGVEAAPEHAPTAASLIKRGLVISLPRTSAPSRLMITSTGRSALGLAEEPPARPDAPVGQAPSGPTGKLGALVTLLRRPEGARIEELTAATGWQAHSVRGAIAGALKKKLKLAVTADRTEQGRVYRITEGQAQ